MAAPALVHDLSPLLVEFEDVARTMEQLDLIVTVDGVTAHLAGALGRKVWVVLPLVPEWRWMRERVTSPWYPSARLFRQGQPGDWASAFEAVINELKTLKT